jgi:N-acetylglucosamine kinase-like BadF-type ATPase
LDDVTLNFLLAKDQSSVRNDLENTIQKMVDETHTDKVIEFAPYVTGSAFIGDKHAVARL